MFPWSKLNPDFLNNLAWGSLITGAIILFVAWVMRTFG